MIRRRAALVSRATKPFISRFSTSSSSSSSSSSSPLLFSSNNQSRRFAVRYFSAAPWNWSCSSDYGKNQDQDGGGGSVFGVRKMSTRTMNNESSNRPPKETILLDGCDFEHWLVVVEPPDPKLTRDEIIDSYIKTLAQVLGSEEEAKKSIYSVSTKHYFAISCIVSEEMSYKIKELKNVRWVLPDSYLDVPNKSYGGEPFIDGQAVPYDPKYHELWLRNSVNAQNSNRKNRDRRRNDGTNTFASRRDNMMNRNMAPPSPAPNPISHAPMSSPNQNFTPASNYQNQARSPQMPNQDFSNRGVPSPGLSADPSQMENPNYQRRDMPPQVQNSNFQNRNTPMQNPGFQSNYAPPPAQNREYQSRDASPIRNMESLGRNIPPLPPTPPQNWNTASKEMRPSMQNQNFQSNQLPSMQNNHFENRDMPPVQNPRFSNGSNVPPVHKPGFPNASNMPPQQKSGFQNGNNVSPPMQNWGMPNPVHNPVHNPGFSNASNMPPQQKPGFQNGNNVSPPMQNWGMPNPVQNPGSQNVPPSNFHMPHSIPNLDFHSTNRPSRVENNSQFGHTRNVQPGFQQNRDMNMGVMANNQNREIPGFTKSVNMQNIDYQQQDMPDFPNSVNMQNRDYQGRDMPDNTNRQNARNQQGWGSSNNSEMANLPSRDNQSQNMSSDEYQAVANTSF